MYIQILCNKMYIYTSYQSLPNTVKETLGGDAREWLRHEIDLNCYYFCEGIYCVAYIFTKYLDHENAIVTQGGMIPVDRHDIYAEFVKQLKREGYSKTTELRRTFTHTSNTNQSTCSTINNMFKSGFTMSKIEWDGEETTQISMSLTLN